MRRLVSAFVVGPVLLLAGTAAMALGMGRVNTLSELGSPLDFSVALSAEPSDALDLDCIRAEVYTGDVRVPPEMVRLRLTRRADGAPVALRVSTGTRMDEPVVNVDVILDCGVRMSRRYVVFIDPPSWHSPRLAVRLPQPARSLPSAIPRHGARTPPRLRGARAARGRPKTGRRARCDRVAPAWPVRLHASDAPKLPPPRGRHGPRHKRRRRLKVVRV